MSEKNNRNAEPSEPSHQLTSEELIAQAYATVDSKDSSLPPAPTGQPVSLVNTPAPQETKTTASSKPVSAAPKRTYKPVEPVKQNRENTYPTTSTPLNTSGSPSRQPTAQPTVTSQRGGYLGCVVIVIILVFVLPAAFSSLSDFIGSSSSSLSLSNSQNSLDEELEAYVSREANTTPIRVGSQAVGFVDVPESFLQDPSQEENVNELHFIDSNDTGYVVILKVFPESTHEMQRELAKQLEAEINALEGGYASWMEWETTIDGAYPDTDRINGSYKVGEEYYRFDEYFFTTSDGLVHSIRLAEPYRTFDVYRYELYLSETYSYVSSFSTISMMGSFSTQS